MSFSLDPRSAGPHEEAALAGPTPAPLGLAVLTISDTRSFETDRSGQLLTQFASLAGHRLETWEIIPDEVGAIREKLQALSSRPEVDVFLLTGGSGITHRDVTPEALAPLLTKELPGFGELYRWLSYGDVGAACLHSRALAGLMKDKLVFAMPGSPRAVELITQRILRPQLDIRTRPSSLAELLSRMKKGS